MRIVVLAGGLSDERDVSLSSGSLIANALMDAGHDVALVDLYVGIRHFDDWSGAFVGRASGKRFEYEISGAAPDLKSLKEQYGGGDSLVGENVLAICGFADVVFLALHGSIGENGQLQAMFDALAIRYTGTGYVGSLLAMDKDLAKQLMTMADIPTPKWKLVRKDEVGALKDVEVPCVIKPIDNGSSVGVSIVERQEDVAEALANAKQSDNDVMIEEMIRGREFSVGVLDGKALPIIEIILKEGFYDYKNKYQQGMAREECPANLDEDVAAVMQELALRVHQVLRLGYYSRIDFILDGEGKPYCLEANTLPGMTPTSLLPQEAAAAGITYVDLCREICAKAK